MKISEELDQRLSDLAQKTGKNKTDYASEALAEYIGELEDIYLAQAAYDEFCKSGEKAISLEDIEVELEANPVCHKRPKKAG
jgi:RHH-type rel operon transcriptional repressor/antitoxin RelB